MAALIFISLLSLACDFIISGSLRTGIVFAPPTNELAEIDFAGSKFESRYTPTCICFAARAAWARWHFLLAFLSWRVGCNQTRKNFF
jgi:hypothetical protein